MFQLSTTETAVLVQDCKSARSQCRASKQDAPNQTRHRQPFDSSTQGSENANRSKHLLVLQCSYYYRSRSVAAHRRHGTRGIMMRRDLELERWIFFRHHPGRFPPFLSFPTQTAHRAAGALGSGAVASRAGRQGSRPLSSSDPFVPGQPPGTRRSGDAGSEAKGIICHLLYYTVLY